MYFENGSKEMYFSYCYRTVTPKYILDKTEFSVDVSRASEAAASIEREPKIL